MLAGGTAIVGAVDPEDAIAAAEREDGVRLAIALLLMRSTAPFAAPFAPVDDDDGAWKAAPPLFAASNDELE